MDFIKIKDLEVYANHGLFEEEKNLDKIFNKCRNWDEF